MSLLSQKHLQNEEDAYKWVEARIWPKGAQCPHCFEQKRVSKMEGKATRFGLYKCYACRKQFRVTVGTIFEKSHVPLYLWLQAFYLIAGSKKGISANQLHRTLGVTLKTAWFMGHRIREAMRIGSLTPPMGGEGKIVEIDETIYGRASNRVQNNRVSDLGSSTLAILRGVIMPKRKEPELDPKEQFKRFQEAAKKHGVDESGMDADQEFRKLAKKAKSSKQS